MPCTIAVHGVFTIAWLNIFGSPFRRQLFLQLGLHGNGQAEQMNEARGIRLVIYRIFAEGRQILTVQAVRRCSSRRNDIALVQL